MAKVNIKFEKNTPFGEYFTYKKFVSASQTIHRLQKQYVYEFQIIRLLDFVELTLIEKSI